MAKGRKTATTTDRLLGTYGYDYRHGRYAGPDLCEEDVWPIFADGDVDNGNRNPWRSPEPDRPVWSTRSSQTGRLIARDGDNDLPRQLGGLSLAFDDTANRPTTMVHRHTCRHALAASVAAASAPVDVPAWPRVVWVDSADSMNNNSVDESEWVPPHEYLAREHGRSVTTSVFEGVGRTLKGRDMSRVRNAVWSQTGFFG